MTEDFSHCKMEYKKDEQGKDILLKDGKYQVMMEWEKPYMRACIEALKPFGDVLEVGFGLGYSAENIQGFHPKSHTIIEYHPVVAARAREWAKRYPNVRIVEDTWQNALPKLGLFDCIFFDDYPLQSEQEMQRMEEESARSQQILKKTERVLKEVEVALPFLSEIKYSDEDLRGLMKEVLIDQKTPIRQFTRFLKELCGREQISLKQFQEILQGLVQEKKLSREEVDAVLESSDQKVPSARQGDRLFIFLNQCLQSHMRKDSRFSCFLSSPVSKYEDEKFVNEIITNPDLDFHEEEIMLEVPASCSYFSGNRALVITITKRI
jgi:hypothetical protein